MAEGYISKDIVHKSYYAENSGLKVCANRIDNQVIVSVTGTTTAVIPQYQWIGIIDDASNRPPHNVRLYDRIGELFQVSASSGAIQPIVELSSGTLLSAYCIYSI